MRRLITILWAMLAIAALMTAVGCKRRPEVGPPTVTAHSTLSGTAAGHEVKADIDAAGGIIGDGNQTSVRFLGHALVIEKERLLLDGKEIAKIPAAARLEIVVSNTTLSVTAEGTNVLNSTIKR